MENADEQILYQVPETPGAEQEQVLLERFEARGSQITKEDSESISSSS